MPDVEELEMRVRSGQVSLVEAPHVLAALILQLDRARAMRAQNELQAENDAAWACFGGRRSGVTLVGEIEELQRRRDQEIGACMKAERQADGLAEQVRGLRSQLAELERYRGGSRENVRLSLTHAASHVRNAIDQLAAEPPGPK